jgi:ribosomal protein L15E
MRESALIRRISFDYAVRRCPYEGQQGTVVWHPRYRKGTSNFSRENEDSHGHWRQGKHRVNLFRLPQ